MCVSRLMRLCVPTDPLYRIRWASCSAMLVAMATVLAGCGEGANAVGTGERGTIASPPGASEPGGRQGVGVRSTLPVPGGKAFLQVQGHPKYSERTEVDVSCDARWVTEAAASEKGLILRLALTGTIHCGEGYKEPADRSLDDFLVVLFIPAEAPLRAGTHKVAWAQLNTSLARTQNWLAPAAEIDAADDQRISGMFEFKSTEWTLKADFVAEVCSQ